jgi:shikimate 5-dehydrogenase
MQRILSGQISGSDTDINSIYVELHREESPRTTARVTVLDGEGGRGKGATKGSGGR